MVTTASSRRRRLVSVRSTTDDLDHAISDEAVAAGVEAGEGQYLAVCGDVITPGALTALPGRTCPARLHLVHQFGRTPDPNEAVRTGRHRRPGQARRWLTRPSSRCASPSRCGVDADMTLTFEQVNS
jgi:hypothetical protein